MIVRAIIEDKINEYTYRIRAPIFDRSEDDNLATKKKDLSIAVASMPKGIYNNLQKGDIVFVGFENNALDSPVILGQLYREALNHIKEFPTIKTDILNVQNQAILPVNTKLGNIEYSKLFDITNNIFLNNGKIKILDQSSIEDFNDSNNDDVIITLKHLKEYLNYIKKE